MQHLEHATSLKKLPGSYGLPFYDGMQLLYGNATHVDTRPYCCSLLHKSTDTSSIRQESWQGIASLQQQGCTFEF